MEGNFYLTGFEEIDASLHLTMPIRSWRKLRTQLKTSDNSYRIYPVKDFIELIDDLIIKLETTHRKEMARDGEITLK